MTNIYQLAEQHNRQYESQLKHIDEVMEQAQAKQTENADLEELAKHRGELADYIEELKDKAPIKWMEDGGPMVMWDIAAERIEELIERIAPQR